ncbi:MAG: glycosyltransferase family 2 protein [Flavobacterium sp.]
MKLSVAMCTYNGEKYISDQLSSILNQTLKVNQIIICDDKSTDNTFNIIKDFQIQHPGIISYYENEVNLGTNKNFEKAISLCDGDYIFLSDQDDIWKTNKTEKIISHFLKNPELEAVFTNADLINDNNDSFSEKSLWESVYFFENILTKATDLFDLIKYKANMVTGATLCFKNDIKKFIIPIPDTKNCFHDEWIAIIVSSRKSLGYISDKLISYRIHSAQQMGVGKTNQNKKKQIKKINRKILEANFTLGNKTPMTFKEISKISNSHYERYLFFKNLTNNTTTNQSHIFHELSQENMNLFEEYETKLKKTNPVFYYFRKIKDKIKGKRQL